MTTGRINQVTISNGAVSLRRLPCPKASLSQGDYYFTSDSVHLAVKRQIQKLIVPDFPRTSPCFIILTGVKNQSHI